ncbi:MAG: TIGR02996 domain-containing protein [Gemmata sp.]
MIDADRAGFLRLILESPEDDTHRLVYADALRESPDPHDVLHGRFLWAGVTLSQFRGPEPVADGTFFDAIRDQAEAAPAVLAAQVRALFGWDWAGCAWDNAADAPDRVTVRLLPPPVSGETLRERRARRRNPSPQPAVAWERGCVHALRLASAEWRSRATEVLSRCPVQRVAFTDVPGLAFGLVRSEHERWRFEATLVLPAVPARGNAPALPALRASRTFPPVEDEPGGWAREHLVGHASDAVGSMILDMMSDAGDRWPQSPLEPDT